MVLLASVISQGLPRCMVRREDIFERTANRVPTPFQHMRIDLRRLKRCMTKLLLHRADVSAVLKRMCGE